MFFWFILLFIFYLLIYYRQKHGYWKKFGLKGPLPVPFLGTSYVYLRRPLHVVETELIQKYGQIVGMFEGAKPTLLVSDPEFIKTIALKEFHSFPQSFTFSSYKHPLEQLFPELIWGSKWKHSRGQITQCFTVAKLRKAFPMIEKCSDMCVKSLADEIQRCDAIEMKSFWFKYYCDTIFQFCLNLDAHVYQSRDNIIVEKMIDLSRPFIPAFIMNMFLPEWIMKTFHLSALDKKALDYLEKLVTHLIETRRLRKDERQTDVLNRLIAINETSSEQSTEIELVAAIVDLLFNGFETSSSLLAWCSWRLAFNQDVQDRLTKEIDSLNSLDYDSLLSAQYLDAVISESLRIDPPETHNERVCHTTYHHPETGIVIPAGSKVSMPIYAMHHNPDNFPDPEKFNPDRFLPDNRNAIKPFTYIPFGVGYRACLGTKYALLVSKMALAKLLQSYRFVVTPSTTIDLDYDWGSILLCADEINVGIEKRM
ncbi:cytochrome P450 3A28-like [Tetranychus urticae]|nr:cytochrome P450 3A28-like [Tetranychus urticae]